MWPTISGEAIFTATTAMEHSPSSPAEAGVEDVGAGMSASWFDFDNDGSQDIYVANMWSAAGLRVSEQKIFHEKDPENIRALYRQHARGNSLYRNQGNGKFQNVSAAAGVEMGRWAWSSDAWDFDHDGYSDLYIANGYISGPDPRELSSFFWRQVVGKSPQNASPSLAYEQGWNAINELVRSDASWSGPERNVFYLNNQDGTFSEVSGAVGLDFPDDSRSFVLADLDQDGRLEVMLKNRNAPQLRILHNVMKDLGHSIAFRLRGQKSNRDAIGTAVTVETGTLRQTKYLQAGSGFLSQHTKELFFGVGKGEDSVRATVRWPSGLTQVFEHVPVNQRIEIQEGSEKFLAKPFAASPPSYARAGDLQKAEPLPSSVETWLIEPLSAPEFSLPDLAGKAWELQSFRGSFLLLQFWTTASPLCRQLPATGPYMIATYRPRGLLRLVRNPYFHEWSRAAQPDGYPDRIDVRIAGNANDAIRDVVVGKGDVVWLSEPFKPKQVSMLEVQYASQFHSAPEPAGVLPQHSRAAVQPARRP